MPGRRESRKRAYRYIMEQVKKLRWDLNYNLGKTTADVNYVSLSDLEGLKEGIADPSHELVVTLEKLLSHVASEAEIDNYLVTPSLPKT